MVDNNHKTLIIGDLHFVDKPAGLLASQKAAVIQLCKEHPECSKVIFLGDLMMHRNPSPTVLLALSETLEEVSKTKQVFILRGNHDSFTKADDGVTALSLFSKPNIKVITHTWIDHENGWVFIPHYEDEQKIKKSLDSAPKDYTIFGHFGYNGVLNSAGDADFSLSISDFKNPTILGHIHGETSNGLVSVIGTPYSTNFGEAGKDSFFGILDERGLVKIPTQKGPRHLVIDYENVEDNLDWLSDSNKDTFTLLRISINTIEEDQSQIAELCSKLSVGFIEVKYKPLLDDDEEFLSDGRTFSTVLDAELIDFYINSSNTNINKETLLSGLALLHEDQQNRN